MVNSSCANLNPKPLNPKRHDNIVGEKNWGSGTSTVLSSEMHSMVPVV